MGCFMEELEKIINIQMYDFIDQKEDYLDIERKWTDKTEYLIIRLEKTRVRLERDRLTDRILVYHEIKINGYPFFWAVSTGWQKDLFFTEMKQRVYGTGRYKVSA